MSVSLYDLRNNLIATGVSIPAIVLANKSKLQFANLCAQNLSGLNLSGCDFYGAALDNCDLSGSNCDGCDFTHASLSGIITDGVTSFYLAKGFHFVPSSSETDF